MDAAAAATHGYERCMPGGIAMFYGFMELDAMDDRYRQCPEGAVYSMLAFVVSRFDRC
jgi:hypothetical protein